LAESVKSSEVIGRNEATMTKSSGTRETFQPEDRVGWRRWLEEHHASSDGVWLVLFKKGAPRKNLSLDEAVEEALSFGWIDSRLNRIDEERFKIIISPRRPGSIWSRKNKRRVEMLIERGSMTPAGLDKVEAAKRDGSWDLLTSAEDLELPPDLNGRLDGDPEAKRRFAALRPSHQARYLFWIARAKRAETRAKRIDEVLRRLISGP
jgi:uncharacterized protein YdeI (YjbR/CyaY-like superfamily)